MRLSPAFRFIDDDLNRALILLLRKARIEHAVDTSGAVRYSLRDREVVENELIGAIRDKAFASWQLLTCPKNWTERYKRYMIEHDVPFREEMADHQLWFLIPRKYRPHSWKLATDEGIPAPRRSLAS